MEKNAFDIVILKGRPAAGKSEVIDYLKKTPPHERIRRSHIGEFEEFDDLPILWERFEDDDIRERRGEPRLISATTYEYEGKTHPGYVFAVRFVWKSLIEKLNLLNSKRLRDLPDYHASTTTSFEFARGTHHGGFAEAYRYLSDTVIVSGMHGVHQGELGGIPEKEPLSARPRRAGPPPQALTGGQEDRVPPQGERVGAVPGTRSPLPSDTNSSNTLCNLRQ